MSLVDIVILAAGESRRYGSPKQLARVDGVAMLRRVAVQSLAASPRVTVVLGAAADRVVVALDGLKVDRVINARWTTGMGSSIAVGIAQAARVEPPSTAAIIVLADQASVDAADLRQLIAAHATSPDRIVAAAYGDGVIGPPCLFPRDFFGRLSALSGHDGARGVLDRHADQVVKVLIANARHDIDTPADLAALDPSGS